MDGAIRTWMQVRNPKSAIRNSFVSACGIELSQRRAPPNDKSIPMFWNRKQNCDGSIEVVKGRAVEVMREYLFVTVAAISHHRRAYLA